MSSYVVLARKWRPSQFADIVGQTHIVRTLMNAIRAERIHQAYLFTGSRGIGKTSIARIFAKAVRCNHVENKPGKENLEWLHSCNECNHCQEITRAQGVDVIEIDGASNNGVDAIREIRENAKYLPASGDRKIYIIDEVHMLTTAAFNALLKTLEEPPAHVIFVMATTEPHKIPATILSRTQRFDFRRVTLAQIQSRLEEVTSAETISAEPGALSLIARAADGSMRDALSLLDQTIAFSGNQLTAQSVRDSIGLIESQSILTILRKIFERQPVDALAQVESAYQSGHDLRVLTRNLIENLHSCILMSIGDSKQATSNHSAEEVQELKEISQIRPLEEMELIFQVLHHGMESIARSPQPKIVLDILLVKCATAKILTSAHGRSTHHSQHKPSSTSQNPQTHQAAPSPSTQPPATSARQIVSQLQKQTSPQPKQAETAPAKEQVQNLSWSGFIEKVRASRPLLASILENGNCAKFPTSQADTMDSISLTFKKEDSYYQQQLQNKIYADQLAAQCQEYLGRKIPFRVELADGVQSIASTRREEAAKRKQDAMEAATGHPVIREAKALFGGKMGPIELSQQGDSNR